MKRKFPIDPMLDASNFPLTAKLTATVVGRLGEWRKGAIVLARKRGRRYDLRRKRLPSPAFPLNSVMVAVPANCLELCQKNP